MPPLKHLTNQKQLFIAVQTSHIHITGGSDAHAAARANILACAGLAGFLAAKRGRTAVGSRAGNAEAPKLVAVNQNVGQLVFQNELQKGIAGREKCVTSRSGQSGRQSGRELQRLP